MTIYDSLKRSRKTLYIPLLAAVLVVATLFALTAERSGAQTWLPEVSITSQADVTEGSDAVFVITASQTSSSDLAIPVNVGEWPASGNVATLADTGPKTVTIPAGQTSATLRVGTEDDSTKEPRGIITAQMTTPGGNAGYRVSQSAGWSTVVVSDDDHALPEVSISAWPPDITSKSEDTPAGVRFKLTPSSVPQQAVTVNVSVTATGDFGARTGAYTVTLPTVGDGSQTFSVPLIDDGINEPDGTLTATLQAGDGYTVGSSSAATVNLIDDDTPQVRIAAAADVTEGQAATFTITASPAPYRTLPVSLNVVASGLSGVSDGARTVNIPSSGSATFTVATTDDNVNSQGGSITATVQSGSGYDVGRPSSDSVDVADNDGPVVTITAGAAVTEGGDATFTLTANPAPSNNWLPVDLTIGATGEYGVSKGARTVSIPLTGTATFTVATTDDSLDEPDGSVTATVEPGHGYRVGDPASTSVTINDDEATPVNNPVITISAGPDINEGEDATFTITATPPLAPGQTLDVQIDSEVPGALNIRRTERITGATTTITQFSVENAYDEADYTLSQILRAGPGYVLGDPSRASVTVIDDDLADVSIRVAGGRSNQSIYEDGTAHFNISVHPPSHQDLTISIAVAATGDFGVQTGTRQVSVPARRGNVALGISPVPDHVHESDGSITVTVKSDSSYKVVSPSSASVTVKDDDSAPGPRITIGDAPDMARAGGKLVFAVTLSQAAEGEVSMDYLIGTFSSWLFPEIDFQDDDGETSGALVFAAGEIEKMLTVHIHPDAGYYIEHNDRIYVELSNPVGGASFAGDRPIAWAEGRLTNR